MNASQPPLLWQTDDEKDEGKPRIETGANGDTHRSQAGRSMRAEALQSVGVPD